MSYTDDGGRKDFTMLQKNGEMSHLLSRTPTDPCRVHLVNGRTKQFAD